VAVKRADRSQRVPKLNSFAFTRTHSSACNQCIVYRVKEIGHVVTLTLTGLLMRTSSRILSDLCYFSFFLEVHELLTYFNFTSFFTTWSHCSICASNNDRGPTTFVHVHDVCDYNTRNCVRQAVQMLLQPSRQFLR